MTTSVTTPPGRPATITKLLIANRA
ncbi:MAG: hypothetical protein QOJ68_1604, partial [Blastococcus sp.]|nr:hypothetical protein [Blastococcus sp.]